MLREVRQRKTAADDLTCSTKLCLWRLTVLQILLAWQGSSDEPCAHQRDIRRPSHPGFGPGEHRRLCSEYACGLPQKSCVLALKGVQKFNADDCSWLPRKDLHLFFKFFLYLRVEEDFWHMTTVVLPSQRIWDDPGKHPQYVLLCFLFWGCRTRRTGNEVSSLSLSTY